MVAPPAPSELDARGVRWGRTAPPPAAERVL